MEEHDTMRDDLMGAGISPRERLGNIEESLKRIEGKLDGKADKSDVISLDMRVKLLEQYAVEHRAEYKSALGREEDNKAALIQLRAEIDGLKVKVSYAAGAVFIALMVGEYLITHVLHP